MSETLIATRERALLRELAQQVAEIAHEPRMAGILQRWRDVNALRRPDRAPVWCRPVGCWAELLPEERLCCRDPWLREVETALRMVLVKREIADDTPVMPWFAMAPVVHADPPNLWGVDIGHQSSAEAGGAWAYAPPLKSEADFDRLRVPAFHYDTVATQRQMERLHDLFGDSLPPRIACDAALGATLGTAAADLRGLEGIMEDMYDAPALLHRLMAVLRDATLSAMDAAEAAGLLTPNTDQPMTCSDPLAPAPPDGRYSFRHLWCMGNSQEFDQVSPAMWEEFCLDYQRPIFARYGLVSYGCCENLTQKIDGVLSIPNLRIFVCSAWTHLETVLEKVSPDYCIMWRQKASDVVFPDDLETIQGDLEAGMRRLQGRPYQVVLRELQTLAGHPTRLHDWTRLAIAAAEQYA